MQSNPSFGILQSRSLRCNCNPLGVLLFCLTQRNDEEARHVLASRVNGATAQTKSDYTLFRRPLPWAVAPLKSSLSSVCLRIVFEGKLRWGFVYPLRPTRSGRQGRPRSSLNQEATRRPPPRESVASCLLCFCLEDFALMDLALAYQV